MRRKATMALAVLTALVVGIASCGPGEPVLRDGLDPATKAILSNPEYLESFRVDPDETLPIPGQTIGRFKILARGTKLDQPTALRLCKILEGRSLTSNTLKCGFYPGVAFRIVDTKGNSVDALFCFKCDVMTLGPSAWQEFGPVRPDILKLAKHAFPDDPEIQALPEKRH